MKKKMIRLRFAEEAAEHDPVGFLLGTESFSCGCGTSHTRTKVEPVLEIDDVVWQIQCAFTSVLDRLDALESILEDAVVTAVGS